MGLSPLQLIGLKPVIERVEEKKYLPYWRDSDLYKEKTIIKSAACGPTELMGNEYIFHTKRYALAAMEQGFKDTEMFLNASIDKKIRQNIMIYGAYPWRYPIT